MYWTFIYRSLANFVFTLQTKKLNRFKNLMCLNVLGVLIVKHLQKFSIHHSTIILKIIYLFSPNDSLLMMSNYCYCIFMKHRLFPFMRVLENFSCARLNSTKKKLQMTWSNAEAFANVSWLIWNNGRSFSERYWSVFVLNIH